MTVIACSKGILAADSRLLLNSDDAGPDTFFTAHTAEKLKVFSGTFAVAVCGPLPTANQWKSIDDIFLKHLLLGEVIRDNPIMYLTPNEIKAVGADSRYFIVMTKRQSYFMAASRDGGRNALSRIHPDIPIAYGTGARVAYLAIHAGKTAHDAAAFTTIIEPTCGYPILSVNQEDLFDFTDKIPKTKINITILKRIEEIRLLKGDQE